MGRRLIALAMSFGLVLASRAQDPAGGAQPGQPLPGPFPAYVVGVKPSYKDTLTEERQNFGDPTRVGKFHDLITRYGLNPTVAVFLRDDPPGADQPVEKLLQALDVAVRKHRNDRLHAFAVFLTLAPEDAAGDKATPKFLTDDNRRKRVEKIEQFQKQAKLNEVAEGELPDQRVPLAIAPSSSDHTRAFGLKDEAKVTVILYDNLRVRKRFEFTENKPMDEAAVKSILDEVAAMVKK